MASANVKKDVEFDLGDGAMGRAGAGRKDAADVIAMAAQIWKDVKASGVDPEDESGNDALLVRLRKKYHDFAISFPIPFRWMITAREYSEVAFEKFIKRHVKAFYKDRKAFMVAQGEYLVILFKTRNPRASAREIHGFRASLAVSLTKDDDVFKDAQELAKQGTKELDEAADEARRLRICAYLKANPDIVA